MARYLWLTQLYPSGLSGTSVKTKATLELLLKLGHQIDLVCIHHQSLLKPDMAWPVGLRIFVIEKAVFSLANFKYLLANFGLLFSLVPFRIKKMDSPQFRAVIKTLLSSQKYEAVLYDGYATLQYLTSTQAHFKNLDQNQPSYIYIDDEDIADLMRQRYQRELNPVLRLFFWTEWQKCLVYERKWLKKIDQLWAISAQTLARLKKLTSAPARVMPTILPITAGVFNPRGQKLVFTGLLSWLENINGLSWFLNEVWPLVRLEHPKVELLVMGQMAKPEFVAELKKFSGVRLLGFVPDLKAYYRQAAAAIAPILINCGIKIKVVTYLSYGLPVITTTQSTWGLGSKGGILTGDTPVEFANAVNQVLASQVLRQKLSKAALATIKNFHSPAVLIKFFHQVKFPGFETQKISKTSHQ